MTSRTDMPKQLGSARGFTLTDASIALCASAMLVAALLTQPLGAVNAVMSFVTPAAQAAESTPQAEGTSDRGAPAWAEHTVYFPDAFPPIAGDAATPIAQF
jgi:hypothetical protein